MLHSPFDKLFLYFQNDDMNYNDENDNLIDRNQNDVFLFIINVKDKGANLDLGISVRGKTKTCEMGKNDLGLFIKDIQDSGAAAKVIVMLRADQ